MGKVKQVYVSIMEDLDNLEPAEIRHLINTGIISEDDVIDHFDYPGWEDR